MAASAQQASYNSSGAMPLSFILDDALDTHAQDIKENIFEYEFNSSQNDPSRQSALVQKRSDELAGEANDKKALIRALMRKNGTIPDDQIAGMADSISLSVDRLGNRSKKLGEYAAGLTMLNGHKAYTEKVLPLLSDISDTKGMSDKLKSEKKTSIDNSGKKK